jgi:hypothetical protein
MTLQLTPQEQTDGVDLGRALASAAVRIDLGLEEQFAELDAIEREFLPRFAGNPMLQLEVRRRVAESKLNAAFDRELAPDFCLALFDAVRTLGFTNLEKRSNMTLVLARRYLAASEHRRAAELLAPLEVELRQAVKTAPSRVHDELLRICRELQTLSSNSQG